MLRRCTSADDNHMPPLWNPWDGFHFSEDAKMNLFLRRLILLWRLLPDFPDFRSFLLSSRLPSFKVLGRRSSVGVSSIPQAYMPQHSLAEHLLKAVCSTGAMCLSPLSLDLDAPLRRISKARTGPALHGTLPSGSLLMAKIGKQTHLSSCLQGRKTSMGDVFQARPSYDLPGPRQLRWSRTSSNMLVGDR